MIIIDRTPIDVDNLLKEYPPNKVESSIIHILSDSEETYHYDTMEQLKFELLLRKEIINASNELHKSRLKFKVFRDSICNPAYWNRKNDGGFQLKEGVKPSDAIYDIFSNGSLYGTECATAMLMVYYKALLNVLPKESFNGFFSEIYLMNWHRIDSKLEEVGLVKKAVDFLPGDRRYVDNPDVNPVRPEWQGENIIDLGDGTYYGHGIGKHKVQKFIDELNKKRKKNAEKSAYLMDVAGRPDFNKLATLYYEVVSVGQG